MADGIDATNGVLTFENKVQEGYQPAYGMVEGPQGEKGDPGLSIVGPPGPLAGGPAWERDYDFLLDTVVNPSTWAGPEFDHEVDMGTTDPAPITWRHIELPMPQAPAENPLNPGDPGYAEAEAAYQAALADYENVVPIDFNDVEIGLWIEPLSEDVDGGSDNFHLGLRGPRGAVYLGHHLVRAPRTRVDGFGDPLDPLEIEPSVRMGLPEAVASGAIRRPWKLAWFTDDGADLVATGKLPRFNNAVDRFQFPELFAESGWAGPWSELRFGIANSMRDIYARSEFNGIYMPSQAEGVADEFRTLHSDWSLAIGEGISAVGRCRVRGVRLRLRRFHRRYDLQQPSFRRHSIALPRQTYPVRGFWYHQLNDPPNPDGHLPVTVPSWNQATMVTPYEAARFVNFEHVPTQSADPNTLVGTGGDGRKSLLLPPAYTWFFTLPRPVYAMVSAWASWSRFVPRNLASLLSTSADIGKSLVCELWVSPLHLDPLTALSADRVQVFRDIITIRNADQPLDHVIGPKLCLVQSVALAVYNFTTQARDLRGVDDDLHAQQAIGAPGVSGTFIPMRHHTPPMIHVQEMTDQWLPGFAASNSFGDHDEMYQYIYAHKNRPFVPPADDF